MGIWMVYYGIANENRERYLAWFENEHLDEKLSRPGYDWASHYELTDETASDVQSDFVALFGSSSTRPFYDPSPNQIKPHQSELTKTMLGFRENALSLILSEEWSQLGEGKPETSAILSRHIRLGIFSDTADDQTVGAWCAQEHFPLVATAATTIAVRKFVASSGESRHLIVEESTEAASSCKTWESVDPVDLRFAPFLARLRVARQA